MTPPSDTVLHRLIGMIRRPRATLSRAFGRPRSIAVAAAILSVSAGCGVAFLMTGVGRLAALDQQVRQLESFGVEVTDARYEAVRQTLPYRPAATALFIVAGWPAAWAVGAALCRLAGNRLTRRPVTFAAVFTVFVHASAVLALRSVVALPVNYARESLGAATSAAMLLPAFSESSFPARLLSAVDLFALWWLALLALGLGMAYERRAFPIFRWLLGLYAGAAATLALIQALRGGL